MSRREPGAAARQGRHARDRLQATLGGTPGRPLLPGGDGAEPFPYHGPAVDPGGARPGVSSSAKCMSGEAAERSESAADPWHARLRWRVASRVALLLAALAVCAGAWFWWQAAAGRPEVLPLSDVRAEGFAGDSSGAGKADGRLNEGDSAGEGAGAEGRAEGSADGPAGRVVVHVAGAVANPGVVRLPAGSRVHQAIAAAGGAAPGADPDRLNLALVLADGQKIQVPREGEVLHLEGPAGADTDTGVAGKDGSRSAGGADGPKVNLNTATLEELDALPKVGPVLAQRILDWRKDHGSFKSVEDLDAVDGVGPKMLEALLPLVTV